MPNRSHARQLGVVAAGLSTLFAVTGPAVADDAPTFDIGVEVTGSTDYMDSGLTNSDHHPSGGITLTPSYGIFYGTIYGATIDYGASEPWLETKFAIGATPTFGNLSVDFNLARRIKIDDPSADRWLPYVTGTYTFNDRFNASLGTGYYAYDDPGSIDFWELYGAGTFTFENSGTLLAEAYWEPDQDGASNDYYGLYGTLTVPFKEKFEAIGKIGFEGYQDNLSTPSYLWGEIGLKYHVTDHFDLYAGYQANDLSSDDCSKQANTDCKASLFAKISYSVKLSDLTANGK